MYSIENTINTLVCGEIFGSVQKTDLSVMGHVKCLLNATRHNDAAVPSC